MNRILTKYYTGIYALEEVKRDMDRAQEQAWRSLARYKFWMFGYHAAKWVTLNHVLPQPRPNPFTELVKLAREHLGHD